MILFKVKDGASQFQNFHVNFQNFHTCFSMKFSQAWLSHVLCKMGSENAHGLTQNIENAFDPESLRAIPQNWQ
jgi:hypothetical protein